MPSVLKVAKRHCRTDAMQRVCLRAQFTRDPGFTTRPWTDKFTVTLVTVTNPSNRSQVVVTQYLSSCYTSKLSQGLKQTIGIAI